MTTYIALKLFCFCSSEKAKYYSADFISNMEHSAAISELGWEMAKSTSSGHQHFYRKRRHRRASRREIAFCFSLNHTTRTDSNTH